MLKSYTERFGSQLSQPPYTLRIRWSTVSVLLFTQRLSGPLFQFHVTLKDQVAHCFRLTFHLKISVLISLYSKRLDGPLFQSHFTLKDLVIYCFGDQRFGDLLFQWHRAGSMISIFTLNVPPLHRNATHLQLSGPE